MSNLADKARQRTDKALGVIEEIMDDPFAEDRDRLKAAQEMLDRGHGKSTQAVIALPATHAAREAAAKLTRSELLAIIKSADLPRLRHDAVDADFEPVVKKDPLLD